MDAELKWHAEEAGLSVKDIQKPTFQPPPVTDTLRGIAKADGIFGTQRLDTFIFIHLIFSVKPKLYLASKRKSPVVPNLQQQQQQRQIPSETVQRRPNPLPRDDDDVSDEFEEDDIDFSNFETPDMKRATQKPEFKRPKLEDVIEINTTPIDSVSTRTSAQNSLRRSIEDTMPVFKRPTVVQRYSGSTDQKQETQQPPQQSDSSSRRNVSFSNVPRFASASEQLLKDSLGDLLKRKKDLADETLELMDLEVDHRGKLKEWKQIKMKIEEVKRCLSASSAGSRETNYVRENTIVSPLSPTEETIHANIPSPEIVERNFNVANTSNESRDNQIVEDEEFDQEPANDDALNAFGATQTEEVQTDEKYRKWGGFGFPWSKEVKKAMKFVFKLKGFRQMQLETINACLHGLDCFVLMPTGGGKSLCYQLPAVVSAGTTQGVTIVVSPLLSLIQDQIYHLQQKGIGAAWLSGTMEASQRKWVFEQLANNDSVMKLLYLTPEMINKSTQVQKALESLYKRHRLARFVIDEAHCLSAWGHDFRPDYTTLGTLRSSYPNVPFMALTATANQKVKMDVKINLRMQDCLEFAMSFNRRNLEYEVVPKTKRIEQDIVDLITKRFRNKSGIIYCTSKKKCEEVADSLKRKHNLSVCFYHAGMDKEDRTSVQNAWAKNEILIIVATVAFGMGIDKADVRFVIHYSFPQSIEGYYQETGRAGRDGLKSWCFLFYSYGDKKTIDFLIDKGEGSAEQKERQRDNLNQMIMFCENKSECRRKHLLAYFGDKFDPAQCHGTCDVCKKINSGEAVNVVKKDVTQEAKSIINLISEIERSNVTVNMAIDIFRGSKGQKLVKDGFDSLREHGVGKSFLKHEAEKIFRALIMEGYLRENCLPNNAGFISSYLKVTTKGRQASRDRNFKFIVSFSEKKTKAPIKKDAKSKGKQKSIKDMVNPNKENDQVIEIEGDYSDEDYYPQDDEIDDIDYDELDGAEIMVQQTQDESMQRRCFDELRDARNNIASNKGILPSAIYDDSTLLRLSERMPLNEDDFLQLIPGRQNSYTL